MIFELFYPWLGFFAFFAAAFFTWKLGLALLKQVKKKKVCISETHLELYTVPIKMYHIRKFFVFSIH